MSQPMLRVLAIASFASLILLAGCHRQASPPSDAPTGMVVAPGDGQVVVSWDQQPGLTYWIFFQAGNSVTAAATGVPIVFDAQSPAIIRNLPNAIQFAFVMNATNHDSRAGPSTPVALATTRLAGKLWTPGTSLGAPAQNLNGAAFGVVPVAGFNTPRFVAVGDLGSIFSGDYNYNSVNPPGVTVWTQAAFPSIPLGFASNLSAVIYTGQFVALGADGSVLTSVDSFTWTPTTATPSIPTMGARMNGLALKPGVVFVAVGNAVNNVGSIFTSADLINWTPVTPSPTPNDLFSVSYILATGTFVATGANGTLLTSTDAIQWNSQTTNTANALRDAAFGICTAPVVAPCYVVVGDAGTILTSTDDGMTWNTIVPPVPNSLRSIVFGSRFLAVGQGGAVTFSDDGTNWQLPSTGPGPADLNAVVFSPAMYVAVGASGANAVSK